MITDADMSVDPPFRIIYVNATFTRITGYSFEEAFGQTPRFLQGPATDQKAVQQLLQALAQNQPGQAELINYRKDGSPFW
ncbi:PAS domain-containing protein, partial [Salmonella sp. SAL4432]|uniref:PAS domain-containing protein n=1 Tax=Salmonella sp. SAL4432 TaxID=3159887 RepID=UPI00397C2831